MKGSTNGKGNNNNKKRASSPHHKKSHSKSRVTKVQKRSLSTTKPQQQQHPQQQSIVTPQQPHNNITQSKHGIHTSPQLNRQGQSALTQMLTPTHFTTSQFLQKLTTTTTSMSPLNFNKKQSNGIATLITSPQHNFQHHQNQQHLKQFLKQKKNSSTLLDQSLLNNNNNNNNNKKLSLLSTTKRHNSQYFQLSENDDRLQFGWEEGDQKAARELFDTISDLPPAIAALGSLISSEKPTDELIATHRANINLTQDFQYDPESPFSEVVQRASLYGALPLSLRRKKVIKELPEGFDRVNYVSINIGKFHSPTFPSDADIINVINQGYLHEELQSFFADLAIENYARMHGVEYLGTSPEFQQSVRRRLKRDQDASEPLIAPAAALNILHPQMEALDGLLAFALPQVTEEQNNRIMIEHLKRKAQALVKDYNEDPFHRNAIRQKHEIAHAERQLEIQQGTLDAEFEDFEKKKGQNLDADEKRMTLLAKRQKIIDEMTVEIAAQKNKPNEMATISQEAFNTIRKLPDGITADNLKQSTELLKKNNPIINAPGVLERQSRTEAQKKREKAANKPSWLRRISQHYQLTKPRISQMVAVTALWGYWSVGNPTSWTDLALLTTGTVALSSAASIINQIRETDVDAKMTRTMSRPLVTKTITIESAKKQVMAYSIIGASLLTPLSTIVPVLGLSNVALYGGLYTSLKRTTPLNTEVGALVGAIPPLMGYFAALTANQSWDTNLTALCFPAAMMIAWQIQHVMLICVRRGEEYNRSGLVMQCKDDPGLKTTVNKGIAWSVISTVISSIPYFTGHGDLTQLFATYVWAIYTVPYAMAMKNKDNKRLGQVLLAGYVVLGLTVLFSLNAQVPADTWGYLFTDGPSAPSPLPEAAPSLLDTLFRGAGRVGSSATVEVIDTTAAAITSADAATTTTTATSPTPALTQGGYKMASVADGIDGIPEQNKSLLAKLTEKFLNQNNGPSAQDDV